jgi:hypothetical protein
MRTLARLVVTLGTLGVVPFAQAEDAAKAARMAPPKPAAAFVEAFQGMTGTWACKGKIKLPDGSGEVDTSSTIVIRAEVDGFAYSGAYEVPKEPMVPNGVKGYFLWAYDAANKKLVEVFADSYGFIGRGTSDGLKDDALVWDEDEVMMGSVKKVRTTRKRMSPTELSLTFERLKKDGTWVTMGRETCVK